MLTTIDTIGRNPSHQPATHLMIDIARTVVLKLVQITELIIVTMLELKITKLLLEASKVQSKINLLSVNEQRQAALQIF